MSKNEISGLSRRHFLAAMAAAGLVQATSPLVAAKTFGYQETALFMGTLVRIDVAGVSEARAEDAVEHAFAKGRELEAVLTRFDSSSPLGVLNSQGSLEDVPPQLSLMLERSRLVHRLTEGSFEPSILPLLQAMQDASARGEQLHSDNAGELLSRVDYTRVQTGNGVRLGEGMSLTLDGIAKGYIAQEMSRELARMGCPNHLVNAGGDIVASGRPDHARAWNIAIQSPFSRTRVRGSVQLHGGALATSGVYEQRLSGGRSHLVIPRTLERPDAVSATVWAPDGAMADALATAFCVLPYAKVLQICSSLRDVEAMIVLWDGSLVCSQGWPA